MSVTDASSATSDRQPKSGEFPLCFSNTANRGDTEAVARWRNRSHYLTRGGWLHYANVIYQYNRGLFGNLLVLSPLLMLAGLVLSFAYTWFRHHPFVISACLLVLLLVCHALDFISHSDNPSQQLTPLRHFRKWVIGFLGAAFIIEATPQCVELVRSINARGSLSISQFFGFVAAAASASTVVRSATPKQLSGGRVRLVIIGLLSWGLIALILVGIVDYLYFGIPPYAWFLFIPFVAVSIALGSLVIAVGRWVLFVLAGIEAGVEERFPVWIRHLVFWSISIASFVVAIRWGVEPYSIACRYSAQKVAEITRPLGRLTDALQPPTAAAQGLLSPEAHELVSQLAKQKRLLDAEFHVPWADEYKALYLGDWLPPAQSVLVRYVLPCSDNTPIYETVDQSDRINEWSLLGPLRPVYHAHAVALLNACAAIDLLPDDAKQLMRGRVSQHCVKEIAASLSNKRSFADNPIERNLRIIVDTILAHHVAARIATVARHGALSVDSSLLKALAEPASESGDHAASAVIQQLFDVGDIKNTLATLTLPATDADTYRNLLCAGASPTPSTGDAAAEAAALKVILEVEALKTAGDADRQYRILFEALLVCLCRLNQAGADQGAAAVRQTLKALPAARFATSDFGTPRSAVQCYGCLLATSPEDVAMLAAGYSKGDDPPRGGGFVPESYVADAFRQSVCDEVNRLSDVGLDAEKSPVYRLTPADGSRVGDPSAPHTSAHDKRIAQLVLLHLATLPEAIPSLLDTRASRDATAILSELYSAGIPTSQRFREDTNENDLVMTAAQAASTIPARRLLPEIRLRMLAGRLVRDAMNTGKEFEEAMRIVGVGRYGNLEHLRSMVEEVARNTFPVKAILVFAATLAMLLFALTFIDPNMTSMHRFYRDALSSAFLFTRGLDADASGTSPQQSGSPKEHRGESFRGLIDAKEVKLSALADPEGGTPWNAPYPLVNAAVNASARADESIRQRNARPFVFTPLYVGGHFGSREEARFVDTAAFEKANPSITAASAMTISGAAASPLMGRYTSWALRLPMVLTNVRLGYWITDAGAGAQGSGKTLQEVLGKEREVIAARRRKYHRGTREDGQSVPNVIGLAFSGGGIRSAALNFGIAQGLFRHGIWNFVDYLSTVSGGGYVGTSIAIFMRTAPPPQQTAPVPSQTSNPPPADRASWVSLAPSCVCLFKELFGRFPFVNHWDNVSDGGHFENLGVYALVQRQCSLIIVGDGEADPKGVLDGLSRLSMLALSDLGVRLEFREGDLARIATARTTSEQHFTVARIRYRDNSTGWLIYLRSSITGDEDEFIRGYKAKNDAFPHESTTDQFFTEEQFEAYRRLGEHIANDAVREMLSGKPFADHAGLVAAAEGFFVAPTSTLATPPPFATPGN
jgi:hypothetical protein